MKVRWKKPVYSVVAAVVILILVRIVLGWLVPGDEIRRMVTDQAAEATGAEVTLGEASVRLWPSIAITMGQGSILGTGQALAEKTGSATSIESYALSLDHLSIDLKIGPLLRGRIETGTIGLSCRDLQAVMEDGTIQVEGLELEISDLTVPAAVITADSPGAAGGGQAPGETIPEDLFFAFSVTADRLFWQDVPYDEVVILGELDARVLLVDSFSALRSTGRLDGAVEVDFERDPWGILDFEAVVTDVPAGALLEPWAPDLASRLECNLSGEVSGVCELKDPDTVTRTLDLTGRLESGQGVLRAGDWLDDIASYLGDRQDLKDIRFTRLDHEFRVSQGRYLVEELSIDGLDTDWTGEGSVGLDGTIDLDLHVKFPAGFTPDLGQWSWLAEGLRDEEQRVNLTLHLTGESARPHVGLKLAGARDSQGPKTAETLQKGLGGFLDKLKTK